MLDMKGVINIPKKKAVIVGHNILKIEREDKANSRFCPLIGPGIYFKKIINYL